MTDSDIYETFDYGYDPSVPEDLPVVTPPRPATPLLAQATVKAQWLPPVGKQTTPSCFVWASTYGIATFAAAQAYNLDPNDADNLASPIYTYIKVLQQQSVANDTCTGGQIAWCLNFLASNGGTPSMSAAPDETGCTAAWTSWGSNTLPSDGNFQPSRWVSTGLKGSVGLDNMRTLISQDTPIAYGTHLYTDFPGYDGSPVPYVGNGQWLYRKNDPTKLAGHCMMIIGYDDTKGTNGAVLIQNSFGSGWGGSWNGNGGYIWMAYSTFQTMAEGGGAYISAMQGKGQR